MAGELLPAALHVAARTVATLALSMFYLQRPDRRTQSGFAQPLANSLQEVRPSLPIITTVFSFSTENHPMVYCIVLRFPEGHEYCA